MYPPWRQMGSFTTRKDKTRRMHNVERGYKRDCELKSAGTCLFWPMSRPPDNKSTVSIALSRGGECFDFRQVLCTRMVETVSSFAKL
jgi:hypothetical protein